MSNEEIRFSKRKIKKNYRSITGHFPSIKNKTSIAYESKLEKSLFLSLEFDNTVFSYYEQPQIEIDFRNKTKIYSADCYIQKTKESGLANRIVEVKYSNEIEKEKEYFEERFASIKDSVEKLGLIFEVYTERIHSDIYLDNLDFLYRYRQNPLQPQFQVQILDIMRQYKSMCAYDLAKHISSKAIDYAFISNSIWELVSQEKLKADLEKEKLTMKSIVEFIHE